MGRPPERMSASPRAAEKVASVATKGGNPAFATISPFRAPTATPNRSPAKIPGHSPYSLITIEPATLISPITMPTERSKPPERITIVWPQATIPRIAVWRLTLRMLTSLRKLGLSSEKVTTISTITAMRPMLDHLASASRLLIQLRQDAGLSSTTARSGSGLIAACGSQRRAPSFRLPHGADIHLVGGVLGDDVDRREQLVRNRLLLQCGDRHADAPAPHQHRGLGGCGGNPA